MNADIGTWVGIAAIVVAGFVGAFAVTCAAVLASRISRRQGE